MSNKSNLLPVGTVIHFSGIPATGKSSFCRFLVKNYGFTHYDLECYPRGWPIPKLVKLWPSEPKEFMMQLRNSHERVAIDWGFPVENIPTVKAFKLNGARLVWFTGNIQPARRLFVERGGIDPHLFDLQVQRIAQSGLPQGIEATVIDALTPEGNVREMEDLFVQVFGNNVSNKLA